LIAKVEIRLLSYHEIVGVCLLFFLSLGGGWNLTAPCRQLPPPRARTLRSPPPSPSERTKTEDAHFKRNVRRMRRRRTGNLVAVLLRTTALASPSSAVVSRNVCPADRVTAVRQSFRSSLVRPHTWCNVSNSLIKSLCTFVLMYVPDSTMSFLSRQYFSIPR